MIRLAALCVAVVVAGAGCIELVIPDGAVIPCAGAADCPDGTSCAAAVGRCVPASDDTTAPNLVGAVVENGDADAIDSGIGGANACFDVVFRVDDDLLLEPTLSVVGDVTGGTFALDRCAGGCVDDDGETDDTLRCFHISAADLVVDGAADPDEVDVDVDVRLVDEAGNENARARAGSFTVDTVAPRVSVLERAVRLEPPAGSLRTAVSRAKAGTALRLTVLVEEAHLVAGDLPRLTTNHPEAINLAPLDASNGACTTASAAIVCDVVFAGVGDDGGGPVGGVAALGFDGDVDVVLADLRDAAGNVSDGATGLVVTVDETPPLPPDVDTAGLVVQTRDTGPGGSNLQVRLARAALPAAEVDGVVLDPQEPENAPEVHIFSDPDGLDRIGRFRPFDDAIDQPTDLEHLDGQPAPRDVDRVFVATVDVAGNVSAVVRVRDIVLHPTLQVRRTGSFDGRVLAQFPDPFGNDVVTGHGPPIHLISAPSFAQMPVAYDPTRRALLRLEFNAVLLTTLNDGPTQTDFGPDPVSSDLVGFALVPTPRLNGTFLVGTGGVALFDDRDRIEEFIGFVHETQPDATDCFVDDVAARGLAHISDRGFGASVRHWRPAGWSTPTALDGDPLPQNPRVTCFNRGDDIVITAAASGNSEVELFTLSGSTLTRIGSTLDSGGPGANFDAPLIGAHGDDLIAVSREFDVDNFQHVRVHRFSAAGAWTLIDDVINSVDPFNTPGRGQLLTLMHDTASDVMVLAAIDADDSSGNNIALWSFDLDEGVWFRSTEAPLGLGGQRPEELVGVVDDQLWGRAGGAMVVRGRSTWRRAGGLLVVDDPVVPDSYNNNGLKISAAVVGSDFAIWNGGAGGPGIAGTTRSVLRWTPGASTSTELGTPPLSPTAATFRLVDTPGGLVVVVVDNDLDFDGVGLAFEHTLVGDTWVSRRVPPLDNRAIDGAAFDADRGRLIVTSFAPDTRVATLFERDDDGAYVGRDFDVDRGLAPVVFDADHGLVSFCGHENAVPQRWDGVAFTPTGIVFSNEFCDHAAVALDDGVALGGGVPVVWRGDEAAVPAATYAVDVVGGYDPALDIVGVDVSTDQTGAVSTLGPPGVTLRHWQDGAWVDDDDNDDDRIVLPNPPVFEPGLSATFTPPSDARSLTLAVVAKAPGGRLLPPRDAPRANVSVRFPARRDNSADVEFVVDGVAQADVKFNVGVQVGAVSLNLGSPLSSSGEPTPLLSLQLASTLPLGVPVSVTGGGPVFDARGDITIGGEQLNLNGGSFVVDVLRVEADGSGVDVALHITSPLTFAARPPGAPGPTRATLTGTLQGHFGR